MAKPKAARTTITPIAMPAVAPLLRSMLLVVVLSSSSLAAVGVAVGRGLIEGAIDMEGDIVGAGWKMACRLDIVMDPNPVAGSQPEAAVKPVEQQTTSLAGSPLQQLLFPLVTSV